jgi:hypothetical protein
MEKTIRIGKQSVKLSNNVAWAMEYKDQFGHDVVQEHIPILASLMESVASIVAENGSEIDYVKIISSLEGRAMDILIPLMQTEFLTTIVNMTWAMAKAADETIDPPKQWVRQFNSFPVDVVAPAVYDLAMKGFVSSKNLTRLRSLIEKLRTIQPLTSKPSSSQESNED